MLGEKPSMEEMLKELSERDALLFYLVNRNNKMLQCFRKPLTSAMPMAKSGETHLKRLANYAVMQRQDGRRIGGEWALTR